MIKNRRIKLISALLLTAAILISALPAAALAYEHDPRLNDHAMADVTADPDAVFGFAPGPDGSLASYAGYDWDDPDAVAGYRQARIDYFMSYAEMYALLDEMTARGCTVEETARAVSAKRNELRMAAYDGDPEGLAKLKERNLQRYGHEEGPLPDELYEQYGSWEAVIEKAFSHNSGMDACVGLYDEYYDYYIAFGYIQDEQVAPVSREYAVTALVEALGLGGGEDALSGFTDGAEASPWSVDALNAALGGGVVIGCGDGTLQPRRTITRAEALVIISRCLPSLDAAAEAPEFTDVQAWARADVDRLAAAGVVLGYGDGRLGADDPLTVAQLRTLIQRLAALR